MILHLLQLDNHLPLNLLTSRHFFCFPLTVIQNLLLLFFLGAATETVVVEAVTELAVVIVVTTVSTERILTTIATTPTIVVEISIQYQRKQS